MNQELNFFWKNGDMKFHVISSQTSEREYSFYCGGTGEGNTGTLEQALEQKLRICESCFIGMPLEEVRKLNKYSGYS